MMDDVRLVGREYKARSAGEREGNSGLRSAPKRVERTQMQAA
jgi:hypothetical protein